MHSAFTQLAADLQFAALGLVLLGVLAQIHAALSLLLGDDQAEPGTPPPAGLPASTPGALLQPSTHEKKPPLGTEDAGVMVTREEISLGQAVSRGTEGKKRKSSEMPEVKQSQTRAAESGLQELPLEDLKTVPRLADAQGIKDKKIKKKKRKKDDEFGDLFSSLL